MSTTLICIVCDTQFQPKPAPAWPPKCTFCGNRMGPFLSFAGSEAWEAKQLKRLCPCTVRK